MKRGLGPLDRVHGMTLPNKQVLPPVIVVIEKVRAPTGVEQGDPSYSTGAGNIVERAVAVSKQGIFLVRERVDEQIRPPVVIIVFKHDSHAGKASALIVERNSTLQAKLFEGAVQFVSKELLMERVVGNRDVGPAIVVEVIYCNTQAFAGRGSNSGSL